MTSEQGEVFLKALGAKHISKKEGWLNCSCLLAPWTHKNHSDHSPSFGISISPGEHSSFHCFACRQGLCEELVQALELYSKDQANADYDFALAHQLLQEELMVLPLPEYQEFKDSDKFIEWPSYWLDSFKPLEYAPEALAYLQGRGYGEVEIVKHRLCFDSFRHMIVFPYFNVFGKFAGARGRSILPATSGLQKHFDYTWNKHNNARLVWFNEEVLNLPGPAVVVEGQFDCLKVERVFPKVLANLTAKPTYEKVKNLADCPFIIQIPDDDEAGRESILDYREFCRMLKIGYKVLEIKSPNPQEKLDPDGCHEDYLRGRIEELL